MLAARLTTLRPAPARCCGRNNESERHGRPNNNERLVEGMGGQNHQGFFNVGAAFFLTVLASQNYSGRLERAALQADLAAAQNEAAALRRGRDDAAIADAAAACG